jgi:hypothetical protein
VLENDSNRKEVKVCSCWFVKSTCTSCTSTWYNYLYLVCALQRWMSYVMKQDLDWQCAQCARVKTGLPLPWCKFGQKAGRKASFLVILGFQQRDGTKEDKSTHISCFDISRLSYQNAGIIVGHCCQTHLFLCDLVITRRRGDTSKLFSLGPVILFRVLPD